MEEILLRLQKLESELKKEREINRILQLQIADINEEIFSIKENKNKDKEDVNIFEKEYLSQIKELKENLYVEYHDFYVAGPSGHPNKRRSFINKNNPDILYFMFDHIYYINKTRLLENSYSECNIDGKHYRVYMLSGSNICKLYTVPSKYGYIDDNLVDYPPKGLSFIIASDDYYLEGERYVKCIFTGREFYYPTIKWLLKN